jgi:hypothetical protein
MPRLMQYPLGRDLLSLLVKANMAVDVPEDQRLSDEDMLGRPYPRCQPVTTTELTRFFIRNPHVPHRGPRNHQYWNQLGTLRPYEVP